MRVHDRLHVGPGPVDAAMQVAFERRLALALDQIAFEVDRADVIATVSWLRWHEPILMQDAVVADADAAVAVVVDDVGLLQHADTVDQLLLRFGL